MDGNYLECIDKINNFLLSVTDTDEYKEIEYLVFSIRKQFLDYLSRTRVLQFEIPGYLDPLVNVVIDKFNESGISTVDILKYMQDNDSNGWVYYYAQVFIVPTAQGKKIEAVNDLSDLFALVLTGFILDTFRGNKKKI